MNRRAETVRDELLALSDGEKARQLARFFKTGEGEYGYGDKFLGITVPQIRNAVKRHLAQIRVDDTLPLLSDIYHECRLAALLLLVYKYASPQSTPAVREQIFTLYTGNTRYINNWDLVDLSAPGITGKHLCGKDCSLLYRYAATSDIWKQRIAIVSTYTFIRNGDNTHTFNLAEQLVGTREDLIQKATGWMLREAGKRDRTALETFLGKHAATMPRTMLRYAIEKFSPDERQYYMQLGKESKTAPVQARTVR